jgi:hypothetical protein
MAAAGVAGGGAGGRGADPWGGEGGIVGSEGKVARRHQLAAARRGQPGHLSDDGKPRAAHLPRPSVSGEAGDGDGMARRAWELGWTKDWRLLGMDRAL